MHDPHGAGALVCACAMLAASATVRAEEAHSRSGERASDDAGVANVEGEIIYVEDRAPEAAQSATTRRVSSAVIETAPRTSGEDLLELVPGLYMNRHGAEGKGAQLFLRGFDAVHGSDIEVRVAGAPINEPSNVHGQGYVDLGFVVPEVVLSVRADKGSFRLGQGSFATAGSVDFELGVPRVRRGHRLAYEVGSTNRHRLLAVLAPQGEPEASFVAVEAMHDEGFGTNRRSERLVLLGQRRVWRSAGRWIDLLAGAYAARFGEPGTLPLADYEAGTMGFYESYVDRGDGLSRRVLASATLRDVGRSHRFWALSHAQWRFLQLSENFTGFLLYPDEGDRRLQVHEALSGGLRIQLRIDLQDRIALEVAGDVLVDSMRQREDQLRDDDTVWQWNRSLEALHLLADLRAGIVAQPFRRVRIESGVRIDTVYVDAHDRLDPSRSDNELLGALSPRFTSSVQAARDVTLFAAYGRGLRPPEARSLTARDAANEDVDLSSYTGGAPRITQSDAAEVGARLNLGRADIRAALFGIWIGNEMLFDHVSGTNVELNSTRRVGFEASAEYAAHERVRLRADVAAVDARFVESGNRVPNAPQLLARAELAVTAARGIATTAQLSYAGPRPLAHGATAGGVTVLELGGGYQWRDLRVDIRVDNALGTRWREGEYHFASWFDRNQPRSQIPRIHFAAGRPFGVRATLTSWL